MYYISISWMLSIALLVIPIQAIELDTSFGSNGISILNFGQNSGHMNRVIPFRIKMLPDKRILLIGDIYNNDSDKWDGKSFIACYTQDGKLDTSFGTSGITYLSLGTYNTATFDIALQSNGNILIVGRSSNWDPSSDLSDGSAYIVCLHKDGILNQSFGKNGVVQLSVEKDDNGAVCSGFYQLEVQSDDSILVVGHRGTLLLLDENKHYPSADYKAIIMKCSKNGEIDRTFGQDGIASTSFITGPEREANGWAIALQKDGKIILAGNSEEAAGDIYLDGINGTQRGSIARFHASGILDETFGDKGHASLAMDTKGAMFFNLLLDDQERIVATGFAHNNETGKAEFLIARYMQDGILDASFGKDGILLLPVGTNNAYAYGTALLPDKKLLVTGVAQWKDCKKFTLVRIMPDGQLDTAFGLEDSGIYSLSLRGHNDISLALLSDDKNVLLAGDSFNGKYFDSALVRLILD